MGKLKLILGASILLFCSVANAATTLIPIDSSLFTVVPRGTATWSGNNLTLTIGENEEGDAAITETPVLPVSLLPEGIIGISFEFFESAEMLDNF